MVDPPNAACTSMAFSSARCVRMALSGTPTGGFVSSFASARDGWEFADKAEAAGAVAMIVPHRIDGVGVPQLVVKDTLIDGLWALGFGNGGSAGLTDSLYFTAGLNGESDGLFGLLHVPEPLTLSLFGAGLAGMVAMRRRKQKIT